MVAFLLNPISRVVARKQEYQPNPARPVLIERAKPCLFALNLYNIEWELCVIKDKEKKMKIIMMDNFNRENISDKLIVEKVDNWWGETIVSLLNGHYSRDPNNPDYFKLVEDDHKLYEFKP